jgi:Tfp pilus assembly protein PilV
MRISAHSAGARPDAAASRPRLRVASALARFGRRLRAEEGFTIIEVIVATLVLVIGLLTAFLALNVALHSSSDVREREQGVSLARQVIEDARSIPYSQLSSSNLVSTLQGFPGLANTGSGSTWTVSRPTSNGYPYTITASLSFLSSSGWSSQNTTGTYIKQVTVTVSWNSFQGASHSYTETTLVSQAGQDPGLQASQLQLATPPWGDARIQGTQFAPVVTSTGITSLDFTVNAPVGTQAIVWTLNGNKQSAWNGSAPSSGTTWTSNPWSLSGLSDGNYTIGAAAEDANGVDGPAITIPVRLIRNVPSAPSVTAYGFNSNLPGTSGTVAEIQWSANPELNVVGYRVYHGSTLICQTSLTTANASCGVGGNSAWCTSSTSCVDLNPGSTTSNLGYTVTALYYDASNTLREGNDTAVLMASGAPTPPPPPTFPSVSTLLDNTADVTWIPPVGGTPVSFYRIYRDGTNYANRYDTVPASSCTSVCTYHDVNRAEAHSYYVTAVGGTTPGSDMAESTLIYAGNG